MKRGISNWILTGLVLFCTFFTSGFVRTASAADVSGVEDFVTRFYRLCLDRDPDSAGLEGWTNNLLNHIQTGADVAEGFIYSSEFIGKNTTNSQYLEILYKAFFDRDADPAGWNTWREALDGGRDR